MSEQCRFFVPGPVWVRPEILQEMVQPMIGHRSEAFRDLYSNVSMRLRDLFGTSGEVFVSTSSGTGLMESALLNTVRRSVLVTTCGAFSERWFRIAEHIGVETDRLASPWGSSISPQELEDRFRGRTHHHYDALTITHNETSTGVMNPLEDLIAAARVASRDTLILVDAVSSLGGAPLRFDDLGIDVCVASTQKALGLPPGLAVMAVSDRAMEAAQKQPYRGTYFDFLEFRKGHEKGGTPFTPAIPQFYALQKQLEDIFEEGLENRWERHRSMRELVLKRTEDFATPASDRNHLSWTITALKPERHAPSAILASMEARGFTLGAGYGDWKKSTFRIGHMGDMTEEDLDAMLEILKEVAA